MNEYLEALNDKQKEAVLHQGKSLLILAGAGSGKTRVITTKIAYMIDKLGADPDSILAVTFTNKAAREMRERVSSLIGYSGTIMVRTFHSFGSWVLRRYGHHVGMPGGYNIYDEDDSVSLLQRIFPERPKKELVPYARQISRAKDYALTPDDDLATHFYDPKMPGIYEQYQTRLDQIGNADFGDLILKPVKLLETVPEVARQLQKRFKIILVDEYQDSNAAQDKLLQLLATDESYVCVVGDDDQSIYRFRGAEVQNIITFPERFPGTDIIRLEQNYRSTQPILELASAVVDNNTGRLGKTLWTDKEEGKIPKFRILPDQEAEADYCADLLGDRNYRNTAILYRTNAQSMAFESAFLRRGIPYQVIGSLRFYEREEIKDILAYMSFIGNLRDEIAFARIVNKPSRGIGKATVDKVVAASFEFEGNILTAVQSVAASVKGKRSQGLLHFSGIIEKALSCLETETLSAFLKQLAEDSGLIRYYEQLDQDSLSAKSENLGQIIAASEEYPQGMQGLQLFLEDIELDRSRMAEADTVENAVTLITMHNTKGLEFDRVIISGLDDGLFPNSRSMDDAESLEEERRIFYVSITRARNELHLLSVRSRFQWGKRNYYQPSRFLEEVPAELIDRDLAATGNSDYVPGMYVFHESYGQGQIVKTWHNGTEFLVMVQFQSGNQGTFIPKYQPLEKISGDDW